MECLLKFILFKETMKKIIYPFLFSFLAIIFSCNNDFDGEGNVSDIEVNSGEANFSKYIALGGSLTSGFKDGALYIEGQKQSYPAIIAEQMKRAGGGMFNIPYMEDELGGISFLGISNKLSLEVVNGGLSPTVAQGQGITTLTNIYSQGPYQNMGVPGAKSYHLISLGYGDPTNLPLGVANPYFVRFASSPNTSILEDAMKQDPTFFSLWIGYNDILGYAMSGGDGSNTLTSVSTFQNTYNTLLSKLVSKGAKGIVANIPNVTASPFFTTVPYNPLTPQNLTKTNPNQIKELNNAFESINNVFDFLQHPERKIKYSSTQANPLLIKDKDLVDLKSQIKMVLISKGVSTNQAELMGTLYGQSRQATSEDFIALTALRSIAQINSKAISEGIPSSLAVNGVTYPLVDSWVLTAKEREKTNLATMQFNNIIKNLSDQYNLAFFDANALINDLNKNSGLNFNGVNYTSQFITGGAFSLDGIYFTSRGYAIIANGFIKAINKKYKSNLPYVDPNAYEGIKYP